MDLIMGYESEDSSDSSSSSSTSSSSSSTSSSSSSTSSSSSSTSSSSCSTCFSSTSSSSTASNLSGDTVHLDHSSLVREIDAMDSVSWEAPLLAGTPDKAAQCMREDAVPVRARELSFGTDAQDGFEVKNFSENSLDMPVLECLNKTLFAEEEVMADVPPGWKDL
ncbi:uncharacterized protein DDB_G0271670-like [Frankliniella occidentalis]|uniref:Uncharacterized protein DDB_G0271670-like n=1 Tax=Frankliniella occidentalis TaxID=133901 RepID=A0A9C6XRZ7_FRAOC|nr:uncharacterized protein DDB_G0271670-like [Frankliniella occidentalis]